MTFKMEEFDCQAPAWRRRRLRLMAVPLLLKRGQISVGGLALHLEAGLGLQPELDPVPPRFLPIGQGQGEAQRFTSTTTWVPWPG